MRSFVQQVVVICIKTSMLLCHATCDDHEYSVIFP
jgi:hypothetical protein